MLFTNCVLSVLLVVVLLNNASVNGSEICIQHSPYSPIITCDDNQYCCGTLNDNCCSSSSDTTMGESIAGLLMFLLIFVCCPYMCYRCCCRRTTRGIIYTTPGTNTTTNVSVNLPPQQVQPVPYPTVVPYPQQTPYPPQHATNPYYGAPPPAYGIAVPEGVQQASVPSAPAPYPHI